MSSEFPKSGLSKSRQGAASVSTNKAGSDREASPGWEELVRGCAKGDSTALSALYDQTSSLVYGVALRVLANPADAEEITIDVYTQVWRTAANFENTRGSVTAWLIMLARSRAIDRIRSRATRMRRETPVVEAAAIPDAGDNPEAVTEAGQRQARVRAAMAGLPQDQRKVVELAFFSGLSHAELAERLQLPLGTVKTRIRSSMMKLRESLGEYA